MDDAIKRAVTRAIEDMHEKLGEELTIDDLARTAMFSKFHFSRVFREATGVSPGRFLTALRLQEAKRLLTTTSLTVSEISSRVGYTSVGTFSSRFKKSVGTAPSRYRQGGRFTLRVTAEAHWKRLDARPATIRGQVLAPSGGTGLIFVGLFPDRIPQGQPVRCTVLGEPGSYLLSDVPKGSWHLLAYSAAPGYSADYHPERGQTLVGTLGPVTMRPETIVRAADVRLRPMRTIDPPLLLALPETWQIPLRATAS